VDLTLKELPVDPKTISAVLEPVCGWRWVSNKIKESKIDIHIANPFKTRLIADNRLKHDKIDARILAELLRADFLPESYWAPDDVFHLRELVRHRTYLVQLRTSVKNRIHGIFARNGTIEMDVNPLKKKNLAEVKMSSSDELRNLYLVMNEFTDKIKPLDKEISKIARNNPVSSLLMTMPAVGPITALTVVAEVGDFNRFSDPKKLASFSGLVPRQRSSGESVRFGKITKNGSRILRYVLVEAALRLRENTDIRLGSFLKRLKEKHGAKQARVGLARKMLTTMWYMVKNNVPYEDLVSQESSVEPVIS
jgi:transposase